ncbi:hypothetical protein Hypma_014883 [Hypsizygus marmoreus]|uniref:Uncharacterized protein n=1 Tax=Hypsizygus marmoreus TaxID=39966 RepID=A0A369KCA8_HYPMA|nr:hypothetical protein Hypma_014883 [Hypsizygus marmoreus]
MYSAIANDTTNLQRNVKLLLSTVGSDLADKELRWSGVRKHCLPTVIAAPGWFTQLRWETFFNTLKTAGLKTIGIITGTAAAHVNYAVTHREVTVADTQQNVVFIDVGHTGTSVSVLTFSDGKPFSGGYRVDLALLEHVQKVLPNLEDRESLLAECRRVNGTLSGFEDMNDMLVLASDQVSLTGETRY